MRLLTVQPALKSVPSKPLDLGSTLGRGGLGGLGLGLGFDLKPRNSLDPKPAPAAAAAAASEQPREQSKPEGAADSDRAKVEGAEAAGRDVPTAPAQSEATVVQQGLSQDAGASAAPKANREEEFEAMSAGTAHPVAGKGSVGGEARKPPATPEGNRKSGAHWAD